jgi:hypothetical protein
MGGTDGTDLGTLDLAGSANLEFFSSGTLEQIPDSKLEIGSVLRLTSTEQTTSALAANQWQSISRPRMAGLSALNCDQPSAEGWFLNGTAGVGKESILLLANPNEVEVQINLEFHLPGEVNAEQVTLAPGAQAQFSLAPFVDAESAFAVRYSTNGPAVSAALQNRFSSGLSATGVELVAPMTALTGEALIPGINIEPSSFEQPKLRLMNLSSDTSEIRMVFHGIGNDSDVMAVTLEPGELRELDLQLAPGEYLLEAKSDGEFLLAIRSSELAVRLDFAWLLPMDTFMGGLTLPLPDPEGTLVIANPSSNRISVSVEMQGQYQSFSIAGFSEVAIPALGPVARVQSAKSFGAALILSNDQGFSVVMPRENLNLGSNLEVFVD